MFIPVEKHGGARIIQFVHAIEIGHFVNVHEIDYCKVFDLFRDAEEDFVLDHARLVLITAEADDDDAIFFREDGLVDFPAAMEMGEHVRHVFLENTSGNLAPLTGKESSWRCSVLSSRGCVWNWVERGLDG